MFIESLPVAQKLPDTRVTKMNYSFFCPPGIYYLAKRKEGKLKILYK